MRPSSTRIFALALLVTFGPAACTLITEIDRSKIVDESGSGGQASGDGDMGGDNMGGDNMGGDTATGGGNASGGDTASGGSLGGMGGAD